jgi:hypothetical protein
MMRMHRAEEVHSLQHQLDRPAGAIENPTSLGSVPVVPTGRLRCSMIKPSEQFPFTNAEEYREWWEKQTFVSYGFCWCECGAMTTISRNGVSKFGWIAGEPRRYKRGHSRRHASQRGEYGEPGTYKSSQGYIYKYAKWHPFANSAGYVFEHRLIMEDMLDRFLWPWEVVHHSNEKRDDNRPGNLMLMHASEHNTMHAKKTFWAWRKRTMADKFPRKFVVTRGRDQTQMVSTWPGIALYMGVSISTAMRLPDREDDPLPVLRSDAVRGVWIEEGRLREWMERHGLARLQEIGPD